MTRPPEFAIIGAQKSGTSFLNHGLRAHPEAWLPPTEVPVDQFPAGPQVLGEELGRLLAGQDAALARGFKRPECLAAPGMAARLRAAFPELRLVVALRDPVSRFLSALDHYQRIGWVPLEAPEAAVRAGPAGERRRQLFEFGRYAGQLEAYLAEFPRARLCLVYFEELRADPARELGRILEFLGLDPAPAPDCARRAWWRRNPGLYSRPRVRLFRGLDTASRALEARLSGAPGWDRPGPVKVLQRGLDLLLGATLFPGRERRLAAPEHAELAAYYEEDVARLEALVGRAPPASWLA